MKTHRLIIFIVMGLLAAGCANTGRYNTQKGAAIGAGLGALTGQIIGRNTESTLIGTGVGTVLGSLAGNYEDQRAAEWRDQSRYRSDAGSGANRQYQAQAEPPTVYVVPDRHEPKGPPGRWMTVPGRWVGKRWVPPHREWRPVDPHRRPYRPHHRY